MMKPFKLQTVLEYRKRRENGVHKDLLACQEEKDALAAARQEAAAEVNRLLTELESAKQSEVRIPELMFYEACIARQKGVAADLGRKLAAAETRVARKRAELVKARQEKRVLELLKEKREAAEKKQQQFQENKLLDEIAVLGFGGDK